MGGGGDRVSSDVACGKLYGADTITRVVGG